MTHHLSQSDRHQRAAELRARPPVTASVACPVCGRHSRGGACHICAQMLRAPSCHVVRAFALSTMAAIVAITEASR